MRRLSAAALVTLSIACGCSSYTATFIELGDAGAGKSDVAPNGGSSHMGVSQSAASEGGASLGGSPTTATTSAGAPNQAGASNTGGAPLVAGGSLASGGTTSAISYGLGGTEAQTGGANSAGTQSIGGNLPSAGATSVGGRTVTGGSSSSNAGSGVTGGASAAASGGTTATGGSVNSGGATASGGKPATSGGAVTGGVASIGGTANTGGTSAAASTGCANASTTIGAPTTCCPQNGAYGCATNASSHKAMCVGGTWTPIGDCNPGQLCDTRPGGTAGSCLTVVPECEGKNPGDLVCGGQTIETCGPDLVSTAKGQTCNGSTPVCLNGACVACAPKDTQCDSARSNGVQTCDASGQWGNPVRCGAATPLCKAGACVACPGTDGPAMVGLALNYCIDSTEVTQGQYQDWLNTNPSMTNQSLICSGNTSFTPTCNWPPTIATSDPVVCVDWCDAYAYCAGVGKRLCGKIGDGPNAYSDGSNATLSQWYAACSSNGVNDYPYGNAYQDSYCNGNSSAAVPVGSMSQCQSKVSGYSGVYDLSGNVLEWEDSCSGTSGQMDGCRLRGGMFTMSGDLTGLACTYGENAPRGAYGLEMGFRCCSP